MKASELIEELRYQIERHGDLDVVKPVYLEPNALYPEYEYINGASFAEEKDAYDKVKATYIEVF